MLFFETKTWFWVKGVLNGLGVIVVSLILIIELCIFIKTVKEIKKAKNTKTKAKEINVLLLVLPLFIYIGNLLPIIFALFDDFELTNISCLVWTQMGGTAWFITKGVLYILLIVRLHFVYTETVFAYSSKFLLIISVLITMEIIISSIIVPITTTVNIVYHDDVRICEGGPDFIYLGIGIFVDMLISFLALYLFLRPLNVLLREENAKIAEVMVQSTSKSPSPTTSTKASTTNAGVNITNKTRGFDEVMIKLGTLTLIMVLTTFITLLIVGVFDLGSVIVIDSCINCICVALFNKKYQKLFNNICCGAIIFTKIVARYCCPCKYTKSAEERNNAINMTVNIQ